MKEEELGYSKEQDVMSGVLGGNLNFAVYGRERLQPAQKCNQESGV